MNSFTDKCMCKSTELGNDDFDNEKLSTQCVFLNTDDTKCNNLVNRETSVWCSEHWKFVKKHYFEYKKIDCLTDDKSFCEIIKNNEKTIDDMNIEEIASEIKVSMDKYANLKKCKELRKEFQTKYVHPDFRDKKHNYAIRKLDELCDSYRKKLSTLYTRSGKLNKIKQNEYEHNLEIARKLTPISEDISITNNTTEIDATQKNMIDEIIDKLENTINLFYFKNFRHFTFIILLVLVKIQLAISNDKEFDSRTPYINKLAELVELNVRPISFNQYLAKFSDIEIIRKELYTLHFDKTKLRSCKTKIFKRMNLIQNKYQIFNEPYITVLNLFAKFDTKNLDLNSDIYFCYYVFTICNTIRSVIIMYDKKKLDEFIVFLSDMKKHYLIKKFLSENIIKNYKKKIVEIFNLMYLSLQSLDFVVRVGACISILKEIVKIDLKQLKHIAQKYFDINNIKDVVNKHKTSENLSALYNSLYLFNEKENVTTYEKLILIE